LTVGIQAQLITRHSLHILEQKGNGAEQKWLKIQTSDSVWSMYLSVFEKALSTFKMMGVFTNDIVLVQTVLRQFSDLMNKGLQFNNAQQLLKNICTLLSKFELDEVKTLEQAYLRPLLYLLDDSEKTLDFRNKFDQNKLPLTPEKIIALKQIYQAITRIYGIYQLNRDNLAEFADVFAIEAGKILYSILVLTDKEAELREWLFHLLTGKIAVVQLMQYVIEKVKGLEKLIELDQLMNRAAFQALQLPYEEAQEKAQETLCEVIEKIIIHVDPLYLEPMSAEARKELRNKLRVEVREYIVLDELKVESGFIRYYPLLVLAAQHYDQNALPEQSKQLLTLAMNLRLVHQLSAVRNLAQLIILAEEIQEELKDLIFSGELGPIAQIVTYCGMFYTFFNELQTENKIDFSKQLIAKILNTLPLDSEWRQTIVPWLNIANIILENHSLLSASREERLVKLKRIEREIDAHEIFSKEARVVSRLLVSAQLLSETSDLIAAMQLTKIEELVPMLLQEFVQPFAIIWEQHEITAAAVLLPQMFKAAQEISTLSPDKLVIDNYLKLILNAMKESQHEFTRLKGKELLTVELSHICAMVNRGNDYLQVGSQLNQQYQTAKAILTQLDSLGFVKKTLTCLEAPKELIEGFGLVITNLQNGNLAEAGEAITGCTIMAQGITDTAGSAGQTASVLAGSTLSILNIAVSAIGIAVNVYYSQKILGGVKRVEAGIGQLKGGVERLEAGIRVLLTRIGDLEAHMEVISQELQSVSEQIKQVSIHLDHGFERLTSHQQVNFDRIHNDLDRVHKAIEASDAKSELRDLKTCIFGILKLASNLKLAAELETANEANLILECMVPQLVEFYASMTNPCTGLISPTLNAANLNNLDRPRELLFLQPLFNQALLPNLMYWIYCCRALNLYLNQFDNLAAVKKFGKPHAEVIKITTKILQVLTLETPNTRVYIMRLLDELQSDPTRQKNIQHIHILAKLCGFSLHQFGEHGFTLWSNPLEGSLSIEQKNHKIFLEETIIKTLKIVLSTTSTQPCSLSVLLMQNVLSELIETGNRVFTASNLPLLEGCNHPGAAIQGLPLLPLQTLPIAQNTASFFALQMSTSPRMAAQEPRI
jgi:hypothetical protein